MENIDFLEKELRKIIDAIKNDRILISNWKYENENNRYCSSGEIYIKYLFNRMDEE